MSTTPRPAAVVVNAPTLLAGVGELARITAAIDRAHDPGIESRISALSSPWAGRGFRLQGGNPLCGVRVIRGAQASPYLVTAYPDPDVEVGAVVTEYLR